MTKDEALRLALDALECWQRNVDCNEPMSKIMGAIKAALEVPEEKYTYGTPLLDAMTKDYVPPQRTWVGLTDEEIMECLDQGYGINMRLDGFAKIIEAKLKEKNND